MAARPAPPITWKPTNDAAGRFRLAPVTNPIAGDPRGLMYWIDTSTGVIRLVGIADGTHPAPAGSNSSIWIGPGFNNPLTD